MKESYGEGLATHTGPESCATACEGRSEALTGVRAGRVFSCVRTLRDADAVRRSGRQHPLHRYREVQWSPAQSETPCTYGNTSHENREIPCPPEMDGISGRVGKSKDVRR
jgi:hypothetical protein